MLDDLINHELDPLHDFKGKIVTGTGSAIEILHSMNEDTLFVYSPHSFAKVDLKLPDRCHTVSSELTGIRRRAIDRINLPEKCSRIVCLGSGSTCDIAKYIATNHEVELVIIPSILSTNAFGTSFACLSNESGIKETHRTKLADHIVLDDLLLRLSEIDRSMMGLADVLSIHTALKDWELAERDAPDTTEHNDATRSYSNMLLDYLLQNTARIASHKDSTAVLKEIFYLLLLSGAVTNIHGSGRPESGSEHVFSKSLEERITVPHGISVALGIKIMSRLQGNIAGEVENAIDEFKLLSMMNRYSITRNDVSQVLMNLRPHPKRHTILNSKKDDLSSKKYVENLVDVVMSECIF